MLMSPDDVCLNKGAIIERCIRRIHAEYDANPALDNWTHVDALTLNVERACQAAIDLAMHVVAGKRLGVPQSSADAFRILAEAGGISDSVHRRMVSMTGFRNVAIHQYRELDRNILRAVAERHWQSLVAYCQELGIRIEP